MFKETKISFKGKTKKNIFLIHGLTGSPGEFIPYVSRLLKHGDLHLISLPGHGKLPFSMTSDYSYNALIESFEDLVESFRKNDMIFICHSLGAFLLDNYIFSFMKETDRFFFISPVINEKLNPKFFGSILGTMTNKDKRFNLKDTTTTNEDLQNYYHELTRYIYLNSDNYTAQKNYSDKRIVSLVGDKDELLLNKENHLNIAGGHNMHIDNPDEVLRIIEDRV